jgi:hypothetical protein
MGASTVSIGEVRTLVAERQRYEEWLQALEQRRSDTPERVFERVRADYAARRDGVMDQLRAHVDGLSSVGSDLERQLGVLEAELTELEDTRAEAMLRTAVGEFAQERWEEVRRDVEARIAERVGKRSAWLAELEDVRALLASARAESAQRERVSVAAAPSAAAPAPPAAPHVQPARAAELLDVSEDFQAESQDAAEDNAPRHRAPTEAPATVDASLDTPPAGVDVLPMADMLVPEEAQGSARSDGTLVTDDGFDDLAFLRSVVEPSGNQSEGSGGVSATRASTTNTSEQKTLRCTDCGTMNLPTEWYCERCGGELAAF